MGKPNEPQMDRHNAVANALRQVEKAHIEITGEIKQIDQAIAELENENTSLPKLFAPFDDLKQGILDLIDSAGERWRREKIRAQLISFSTGMMGGIRGHNQDYGNPLTLRDLDGAVNGVLWPEARAQFLSGGGGGNSDDLSMYAVFGDAIKATLSKVMETITPEEFGYGKITKDNIGPTRAEMHGRITANNQEIDRLKARRKVLQQELSKFIFK